MRLVLIPWAFVGLSLGYFVTHLPESWLCAGDRFFGTELDR